MESGWWFGTLILFVHILGIIILIIPTDELHHFSLLVGQPPTVVDGI